MVAATITVMKLLVHIPARVKVDINFNLIGILVKVSNIKLPFKMHTHEFVFMQCNKLFYNIQ